MKPTWLTDAPIVERQLPVRRDPGYDHRPLSRKDLGTLIRLIPAAIVVIAGMWAFCVLLAAFSAPVPA